jgi:hypothetical protein
MSLDRAIRLIEALNTVLDLVGNGTAALDRVVELQRRAAGDGRRLTLDDLHELERDAEDAVQRLRETIGHE